METTTLKSRDNDVPVSSVPELMAEWHPTRNEGISPQEVLCTSHTKYWWRCPKGHTYKAYPKARFFGQGCPYCSKNRIRPGFNDLETLYPKIAETWDDEKNLGIKPSMVFPSSDKKYWWKCPKGHSYESSPHCRIASLDCPFCSGKRMGPDSRTLASEYPQFIKEWDYEKNGIGPNAYAPYSGKTVWWICPNRHSYSRSIISRTTYGMGCPICGPTFQPKGHDKRTRKWIPLSDFPDLAAEWHPTLNGDLTPEDVPFKSSKKAWWMCPKGHQYQAAISNRTNGTTCPYCCGHKVLAGFNDLATTNPEILPEWDYDLNTQISPQEVSMGSERTVWWKCPKGHSYELKIDTKLRGYSCPYCSGRKVLQGYNDLETVNPLIASQWHPTKNGDLTPRDVTAGSNKKVWWMCDKGHEWDADIQSRTHGIGCPICSGHKIVPGINDLMTVAPELAREWHPTKNGDLTPRDVGKGCSRIDIWWMCPKGHEWKSSVNDRYNRNGCPFCSNKRVLKGFNDLKTTDPEIASQWHPTKNGGISPEDFVRGSGRKVWWMCDKGHEWVADIHQRAANHTGCPYCSGRKVLQGFNDLESQAPELAMEWHPTKNGDLKPSQITKASTRKVWWQCPKGHEWQAKANNRFSRGSGCPICSRAGRKR